jgi:hypothetical protein
VKPLNIGCEFIFHTDWEYIDTISISPEIRKCDVSQSFNYSLDVINGGLHKPNSLFMEAVKDLGVLTA